MSAPIVKNWKSDSSRKSAGSFIDEHSFLILKFSSAIIFNFLILISSAFEVFRIARISVSGMFAKLSLVSSTDSPNSAKASIASDSERENTNLAYSLPSMAF